MHVRLIHHRTNTGWRRVRIVMGADSEQMSLRGVMTLRDNDDIDEWSPIRDALFASKALVIEDVEDIR